MDLRMKEKRFSCLNPLDNPLSKVSNLGPSDDLVNSGCRVRNIKSVLCR